MQHSKHNIFSKIKGSNDYFLVNLLSGHADILEPSEAERYRSGLNDDCTDYIDKGYWVDPVHEERLFRQKYLDFIDERENDEVQLFLTPWYTCNFNCSYCFQDEYTNPNEDMSHAVVDAFFAYVDMAFAMRKKYITLFGGEPLLTTPSKMETVRYILEQATKRHLEVAVVTNGYNLLEYLQLLKQSNIREIQVTLDGTRDTHDARRMLKGGQATFDKIANGIDALLQNHIAVNLRMIVDKDNIGNLPQLADEAIRRGWTEHPLFKTALGRNYELHHCQTNNQRLYSRIDMYADLYDLIRMHPQVLRFHKPAFSIAKFLFENGELPNPLFDSCSGTKTEWAFDYTGRIFSCTATVGNASDALGTFYPQVSLNHDLVAEWEERDVLSIDKCRSCAVQLACGGGCAAIAKNRTGKLHSPDCRPVKELLGLGVSLYSDIEI
jgi:uncharacterized protein